MATKTVKLMKFNPSDKVMKFVDFARFCSNQGLEAYDVAELVTLAERAFRAGENYCNEGDRYGGKYERANDVAGERFEIKAKGLGFTVSWPGLWPRLEKVDADGVKRDVYLPTFKD